MSIYRLFIGLITRCRLDLSMGVVEGKGGGLGGRGGGTQTDRHTHRHTRTHGPTHARTDTLAGRCPPVAVDLARRQPPSNLFLF